MFRYTRSRNRPVKNRDFVNISLEPVVRTIKHTTTADVNIITRGAISTGGASSRSDERAVIIGFERGAISNGGNMVPFPVGKRIGRVERATVGGPNLDCIGIDKPILDRVILSDDSYTPWKSAAVDWGNPVLQSKGTQVLQELIATIHPAAHAVECRGVVIRFKTRKDRRTRAGVTTGRRRSSARAGRGFVPRIICAVAARAAKVRSDSRSGRFFEPIISNWVVGQNVCLISDRLELKRNTRVGSHFVAGYIGDTRNGQRYKNPIRQRTARRQNQICA